jgi:hypothetical protein
MPCPEALGFRVGVWAGIAQFRRHLLQGVHRAIHPPCRPHCQPRRQWQWRYLVLVLCCGRLCIPAIIAHAGPCFAHRFRKQLRLLGLGKVHLGLFMHFRMCMCVCARAPCVCVWGGMHEDHRSSAALQKGCRPTLPTHLRCCHQVLSRPRQQRLCCTGCHRSNASLAHHTSTPCPHAPPARALPPPASSRPPRSPPLEARCKRPAHRGVVGGGKGAGVGDACLVEGLGKGCVHGGHLQGGRVCVCACIILQRR